MNKFSSKTEKSVLSNILFISFQLLTITNALNSINFKKLNQKMGTYYYHVIKYIPTKSEIIPYNTRYNILRQNDLITYIY